MHGEFTFGVNAPLCVELLITLYCKPDGSVTTPSFLAFSSRNLTPAAFEAVLHISSELRQAMKSISFISEGIVNYELCRFVVIRYEPWILYVHSRWDTDDGKPIIVLHHHHHLNLGLIIIINNYY